MAPLSSRELVPLALGIALVAAVGSMALEARQERAVRALVADAVAGRAAAQPAPVGDGPPVDATPVDAPPRPPDALAAGTVDPADLGALPLRDAALPAPTRDLDAIRRRLLELGPGTYIDDMLADGDSLLVRWPDRTVAALRVWVQPHADVPHWSDDYPRVVRSVFPEWSAAGFPIRFLFVVDSAGADVHVRFTTSLPARQIGVTDRLRDRSGWLVGASVVLATEDEDGEPLPPGLVAGTARHEVGHVLGLGHARSRGALMYPESYTTTIEPLDRATLHLLYMLPPGSVR